MNKSVIQKYAIWARNELIGQVAQRAYQYGINEDGYGSENAAVISGRVLTEEEKWQRHTFVMQIQEHGYQAAVEEVAYTWFNRFVALRFMEVNDYLPTHIRVFSDADGGFAPEILKDVLHLELPGLDKAKVSELLNANKTDELYRYLLLTQCNALNEALPEMFERLGSYTEMLLPNNILRNDGVLGRLVSDIPEDDWRDAVQIIGWMYQYYNTEPKQAVFDGLKKNVKISKDKIPAATQLFTPDWIVRYMVENSLGRLWIEHLQANSPPLEGWRDSAGVVALRANWKYYLDEAEQTPEVTEKLCVLRSQSPVKSPEGIRLIDPCMGSGHGLVYAFEVLMQIYESVGVSPKDAAKLILEKNIFGLDIDRRAYQLAYFSLMMKARQYNRRIFTENVKPQVYHPAGFPDGEEYGSLVKIDILPPMPQEKVEISLFDEDYDTAMGVWNFKRLLAQKYDVVVTNPPYMGSSGMGGKISEFVKKRYPDSKSDLFAVFIERCGELLKPTGYQAMITQHAWMFLSSYEKLRGKLLHHDIVNMAHLGARAFEEIGGEVVQTTAFVLSAKKTAGFQGTYARLVDFGSQDDKETAFLSGEYRHIASADNFAKIPGSPVAYWLSIKFIDCFKNTPLSELSISDGQTKTGDNDKYLRLLWEVEKDKIGKTCKWAIHVKGGAFRRWYGNIDTLIDWSDKAREHYRKDHVARIAPEYIWFRRGLSWTLITSSDKFAVRILEENATFNLAAPSVFMNDIEMTEYVIGFLNSSVAERIMRSLNPTLNTNIGDVTALPIIIQNREKVTSFVLENIAISRTDWDSFETSWDFTRHPLIPLPWRGGGNAAGVVAPTTHRTSDSYHKLPYNPELKQRARELRRAGNLSEVLLWRHLKGGQINGWDFDRQKIIGDYIVDFYSGNINLVVEIDGESHDSKGDYDERRDLYLKELGLSVLHIPDMDVKRNIESVVEMIRNHPSGSAGVLQEGNHPVRYADTPPQEGNLISEAFADWEREAAERFITLKDNEEELNRIFIDVYGLSDELTPEVDDKDVTVRRADLPREIRSLISYAVGCMFGRYSLSKDGLVYAGGEWNEANYRSNPSSLIPNPLTPDRDNIIPICDDEYFDDDITGRFVEFVKTVYGADTLEENLKYIADALSGSGTPREVVRKYFLNDFYKDHLKIYQKRPIYWLFDSGKKNGFKALVYLHRYSRDLLAKLRTDYVHEQQERYRTQLAHIDAALNTAAGTERVRLLKQQDKLAEQFKEIGAYEEKIHHLADQNIEIDLDDGVKVNYAKFEDVLAKLK